MKLQRLNTDTSWLFTTPDSLPGKQQATFKVLVDPWIKGREVDIFTFFNTQYLSTEPLQPDDPNSLLHNLDWNCIVLTQPFGDHSHEETLKMLLQLHKTPIYAVSTVVQWLRRTFDVDVIEIGEDTFIENTGITLKHFAPTFLDPTHGAMLFTHSSGSVFYAPHGYKPSPVLSNSVSNVPKPITLISTTMFYHLPFYLGGPVNLGLKNAKELYNALGATQFFETHSDPGKIESGLVKKLRTITCADWNQVLEAIPGARKV
jgi:hypothetical protein